MSARFEPSNSLADGPPMTGATPHPEVIHSEPIGDIIRRRKKLTAEQIEQVLLVQRQRNLRFGDAAVALNLISHDDVLWALSQQFRYPYSSGDEVKFDRELVVAADPFCDEAEVFRDLRSQLMTGRGADENLATVLAVTSPNVGDGKSFFASNIAVAFSQLGGRTLIIDADMRTPRLHRLFGIKTSNGLSGILSGRAESDLIQQVVDLPSLFVLPVGTVPPNPLELVQRPAFSLLLHELSKKFDHIVVDTPAASHGADARVIAQKCGAALVIGRRGKTQMKSMDQLLSTMRRARTKVAGVVLNEH